jgi:hypothetical protein
MEPVYMTDEAIMQQALDTLQGLFGSHSDSGGVAVWRLGGSSAVKDAITALRSRLEQPEDGPMAWVWRHETADYGTPCVQLRFEGRPRREMQGWVTTPLYTHPQPAAWVGLTDKEINSVIATSKNVEGSLVLPYGYARDIEAKLKEKNNG